MTEPAFVHHLFTRIADYNIAQARRAERKALLEQLKSDPSTEALRELWAKTKQDAAARPGKDAAESASGPGGGGTSKP